MNPKGAVRLAVTAEIARGGVVLMAGLGGRLGILCTGAVIDAGLRAVAVASVDEAILRLAKLGPKMVLAPGTLTRSEREALSSATRDAGIELVELPVIVEVPFIAHAIARTLARFEARRASG